MKIRILLADDHKMMREGLCILLNSQPGLQVVAEAENGRTAVQLCQKLTPDVAVMDVSMPDLNGIDATRQIVSRTPQTKVVALSMHADHQFAIEMSRAGASGYLLKDSTIDEFVSVIRGVVQGQSFFSPKIPGLCPTDSGKAGAELTETLESPRLTDREREVLQLLAEGKSTKEIAALLFLSAKTVETHRLHLMDKLGIYSVAELTKYAIREGLTSLEH